jgi:hypothetical protein
MTERTKADAKHVLEKVELVCQRANQIVNDILSLDGKVASGIQANSEGQRQVISEIHGMAEYQASATDTTLGSMQAIVQASMETHLQAHMHEVNEKINQVHQSVSQTTIAGTEKLVDAERSILEGVGEVKAIVDVLPNSLAVQSVQMEASSRALDNVLEVLKAIQGTKVDVTPLTTEIHQMRADLKLALPVTSVPTDLNPTVVVQNVNRRGRIRFDMKTGLLTFASSITFVRRAPSESPTATFEHPEEVRAALGDAARSSDF